MFEVVPIYDIISDLYWRDGACTAFKPAIPFWK